MKLPMSIVGRKLPADFPAIALNLRVVDVSAQLAPITHLVQQAGWLEHTNLDLSHVRPTGMFESKILADRRSKTRIKPIKMRISKGTVE